MAPQICRYDTEVNSPFASRSDQIMPTFNGPVQITNIFKPKIWGRRDLAPLYSMPAASKGAQGPPASERIGEVWITDESARLLNGPAAGLTLAEASEKYGSALHGSSWPGNANPYFSEASARVNPAAGQFNKRALS